MRVSLCAPRAFARFARSCFDPEIVNPNVACYPDAISRIPYSAPSCGLSACGCAHVFDTPVDRRYKGPSHGPPISCRIDMVDRVRRTITVAIQSGGKVYHDRPLIRTSKSTTRIRIHSRHRVIQSGFLIPVIGGTAGSSASGVHASLHP
jgi:hypothetical protein